MVVRLLEGNGTIRSDMRVSLSEPWGLCVEIKEVKDGSVGLGRVARDGNYSVRCGEEDVVWWRWNELRR